MEQGFVFWACCLIFGIHLLLERIFFIQRGGEWVLGVPSHAERKAERRTLFFRVPCYLTSSRWNRSGVNQPINLKHVSRFPELVVWHHTRSKHEENTADATWKLASKLKLPIELFFFSSSPGATRWKNLYFSPEGIHCFTYYCDHSNSENSFVRERNKTTSQSKGSESLRTY